MDGRLKKVAHESVRLKGQLAAIACSLLLLVLIPARVAASNLFLAQEVDITREGTATASTWGAAYPPSLAIDGDPTTSWFSTGVEPGGVPTRFTWTHTRNDLITTIFIHSNGQNSNPSFRTKFGFGNVVVQVLNAANQTIWQQSVSLPGTPDPDVTVHPNVVGRSVQLLFSGHETKDCGGFSELRVMADRTPPTDTPVPPTPTDVPPTLAPTTAAAALTDTPIPTPSPTVTATNVPSATPAPSPSATATELPGAASGAARNATIVALNPVASPPASAILGDCDGDGKLTESDALCALEMSVGLRPVRLNMDMDNSGDVNSRDAVIILQRALGK